MTEEHNPFTGNADYWWYKAKAELLSKFFGEQVSADARVLDIGSADGPAVHFIEEKLASGTGKKIAMDITPEGLRPEDILGSVEEIPLMDSTFDIVSAFDVIEHVRHESKALDEIFRVLKPGGKLFISVPAYQWAWSKHDVELHHYRRYTRGRISQAAREAGFQNVETSYGFFGTFPIFALQRITTKLRGSYAGETPTVSPLQEKVLLTLAKLDAKLLQKGVHLPFGSSVLLKATKPLQ